MATLYHSNAKASWQGNYFPRDAGPGDKPEWHRFEVEVTAAQLALNNVIRLVKLSSDVIVLGGQLNTDELDSHATPTLVLDVGYAADTATDDPDFFVNGSAGASANVPFIAGIGAASAAYVPADNDDYFVEVLVQTAPATAAAGTITVSLLLAGKGVAASTVE